MVDEANVTNPLVKMHLKRWIEENLRPDISFSQVPFEELVKDWEDLTLQEAKTMAYKDERIALMLKGEEEPEENPLLERFMQDIQTARNVGIEDRQLLNALRKVGLDLEKPTSAGLASAKREVERLTKDLEEAKKAKVESPPAPAAESVKTPRKPQVCYLTGPEVDVLYNSFAGIIKSKLDRDLTAKEKDQFDNLVESLTCIKGIGFSKAKEQVNILARALVALGKQWKPSEQAKSLRRALDTLTEKSIRGKTTLEEEAELRDWLEEVDEELPFMTPREAMERGLIETPSYRVIASNGPPPYSPGVDGKILLSSWMELNRAEADVTWFTSKGFSDVRVEEEE